MTEVGLKLEEVRLVPFRSSPRHSENRQDPQDKLIRILSRNNCLMISKYSAQPTGKRLNTHALGRSVLQTDNWVTNQVTLPPAFPPTDRKRGWVLSPLPLPTSFPDHPLSVCIGPPTLKPDTLLCRNHPCYML